jgi:hypothetical protein
LFYDFLCILVFLVQKGKKVNFIEDFLSSQHFSSLVSNPSSLQWRVTLCYSSFFGRQTDTFPKPVQVKSHGQIMYVRILLHSYSTLISISIPGGSKSATRATIATALLIWILAVVCGLPALFGSHVAVRLLNGWHQIAKQIINSIYRHYPFPFMFR